MTIDGIESSDRLVELAIDSTSFQYSPLHGAAHAAILKMLNLQLRQGEEVTRSTDG